ncbi:hypothetical protein JXJ21_01470 [candidate division KSB1 bacterium]|nr:hypothetical protein [candidate division KSB1 bacterium]
MNFQLRHISLVLMIVVFSCGILSQKQTADEFAEAYFNIVKRGDIEAALSYRFTIDDEALLVEQKPSLIGEIKYTDSDRFIGDFFEERRSLFRACATRQEVVQMDSLRNRADKIIAEKVGEIEKEAQSRGIDIDRVSPDVKNAYFKKVLKIWRQHSSEVEDFMNEKISHAEFQSYERRRPKVLGKNLFFYKNTYIVARINENDFHRIEVEKVFDWGGKWRITEHN